MSEHDFLIDEKPMILPVENKFKNELTEELHNLLQYWSSSVRDVEYGGFYGEIDISGHVKHKATKGVVLNSRILWAFAAGYGFTKNETYKELAEQQFQFVISNFWDADYGGVFWEVDYKGNPINKRKQAYAQGFAIYGFSELYRVTGNKKSLEYAIALYKLLEENFWDEDYQGYIEALQDNFDTIADMRLSEKDLNAPKSMNTHLHILEPYTNLLRVWPEPELKRSVTSLLDIFQYNIINETTGHFKLFFDLDWTSKTETISFGHDIEGAWLLREAALELGDTDILNRIENTAVRLVDITCAKGVDTDGSFFNEFEAGVFDKEKHWWVQAEAMVGLFDAFEITKDTEYLQKILPVWQFIKTKIRDKEHGEWYWRLDKNNKPVLQDYKVGFWKCPYHNTRALIELLERLDKIEAHEYE